jgi:hypothetical protein
MTRLALFNYLVKANSYNGLIAFSESLEKEKDYLLSDNILKYVKLANQNKLQKEMGWLSDKEKSINNSTDKNNKLFLNSKKSKKKRTETRRRLFGIPIIVYKKKTGEFVKQYQCIIDACDELDVDRRNVNKCLNGIRYKSVGGYVFKYKN